MLELAAKIDGPAAYREADAKFQSWATGWKTYTAGPLAAHLAEMYPFSPRHLAELKPHLQRWGKLPAGMGNTGGKLRVTATRDTALLDENWAKVKAIPEGEDAGEFVAAAGKYVSVLHSGKPYNVPSADVRLTDQT
jgi:hypothetical protein